ncbi:MAG: FKBP-type peptidyl-prolyl cis-trans isomerase, partial [Desulfobacterales bacterium]
MMVTSNNRITMAPFVYCVVFLAFVFFWSGCASVSPVDGSSADPSRGLIAKGDVVALLYVLSTENGQLVASNRSEAMDREKSVFFYAPDPLMTEEVVVGKSEHIPGIHQTLIGMVVGQRRRVTLTPDEAFGFVNKEKRRTFPREFSVPKRVDMPSEVFQERFNRPPATGEEVRLVPHFPHRVVSVENGQVTLDAVAVDGGRYQDNIGTTTISVREDVVLLDLKPEMGADIPYGSERGRIIDIGKDRFTVDFNHPMAGQALELDAEVTARVAAADLDDVVLDWIADPHRCQEKAFLEDRPQVAVLHREGCHWCEKLFSETMTDPRIRRFSDRFVWCSIDTGDDPDLKSRFRQDGTPNVLLINP